MSLFNILVNIEANTGKLVAGVDQASSHLEKLSTSFEHVYERAVEWTAAYASIRTMRSLITDVTNQGEELQLLAVRFGSTAQSLTRLQYAATTVGVPFEQLTSALDQFHEQLGRAADGSGRSQIALRSLGIDAQKLLALPFDQQLTAIADRLSQIPNPSQRAAYEMQLFGETGARLDPILSKGAAGIAEFAKQADEAGFTLDNSTVKGLSDTRNALDKMDASVIGASRHLVANLAPAITGIAEAVQGALKGLDGLSAAIAHGIAGAPTLLGRYNDEMVSLAKQRQGLLADIASFQRVSFGTGLFDSFIANDQAKVKAIEAQMNQVNQYIIDLQKRAADAANAPQAKPNIAAGQELSDVIVTARKYQETYQQQLDDFYKSLDQATQTEAERQVAQWDQMEAQLDALRSAGLVSAEEYSTRLEAISEQFVKPVEITAKRLEPAFHASVSRMQQFAVQASRNMENAFAQFLFDPFQGGVKGMLTSFLDTIRHMIANEAALKLFAAIGNFGNSNAGAGGLFGAFASGLGALFGAGGSPGANAGDVLGNGQIQGFATGGSFDVGGAGGTDSQLVAFRATPGEHVQVGGSGAPIIHFAPTYQIGAGVNRAEVLAAMNQTHKRTIADMTRLIKGGAFAH